MTFIECKDIMKLYADPRSNIQIPALRGVDLSVEEGELTAIIGPSGSGKSTLMNLIGGIDTPSTGTIIVGDDNITSMTEREITYFRRNRVGFLYQLPERNLLWNLSSLKNVMLPMKIARKLTHSQQKKRAIELLSDLGLEKRKNHKPAQLSGGEAQRVGLAVALANNPDVVLADEPTGELDSTTTYKIIDYFKSLNQKLGKTFIVVTHDRRFADMTKRVINILDGRLSSTYTYQPARKEFSKDEEKITISIDRDGFLQLPEQYQRIVDQGKEVHIVVKNGVTTIEVKRDESKND